MKCAVLTCPNNCKNKLIRFHGFPRQEDLFKQWESFCGQEVDKKAKICSEHFLPEDYERTLKVEMGFAKYNLLRKGAVPTVNKHLLAPSKKTRKKLRLPQKKLTCDPLADVVEVKDDYEMPQKISPTALDKSKGENFVPPSTNLGCTINYLENKIETLKRDAEANEKLLKDKIEVLKAENNRLQECSKKRLQDNVQLEHTIDTLKLEKSILKEAEEKWNKQTAAMQMRLNRAEFEQKNLEQKLQTIFSPGQIKKIKRGNKKLHWSEEDISQSIRLYTTSPKAYLMLKEKNYPLPSVRTLQFWAKKRRISFETVTDDGDKVTSNIVIEMDETNADAASSSSAAEIEKNISVEMIEDEDEQTIAMEMVAYSSDEDMPNGVEEDENNISIEMIHSDSYEEIPNGIVQDENPWLEINEFILPCKYVPKGGKNTDMTAEQKTS
ncbi:uncharacterized protein LOC129248582 [Anastrepha obliqua]|uniref:uncharacterized protein LOC129248582 n=1 Tax=Anastrepha obliqua TaxID=95512 RepID=UPI00240A1E10|nr:uncharacterized protein LOC129248582 [Anastrepha obliqua]